MKISDVTSKFALLRARVESDVESPGIISVTSARRRDGKAMLAYGLAKSLSDAGFRVLFVNANPSARKSFSGIEAPQLSLDNTFDITNYILQADDGPDTLLLAGEGVAATASSRSIASTFEALRSKYDYTVICTPEVTESNVAISFAYASDAVLIALRIGRQTSEIDARAAGILAAGSTKVLGVVTLSGQVINDFSSRAVRAYFSSGSEAGFADRQAIRKRASVPVS